MSSNTDKSLIDRLRRWWCVVGYAVRFFGPPIGRFLRSSALLLVVILVSAQVLVRSAVWVHSWPPFEAGPLLKALAAVGVYGAIGCTLTVLALLLGLVHLTRKAVATVAASILVFLLMTESFEVLGRLSIVMPALMGLSFAFVWRRLRPFTTDSWNGKPLDPDRRLWGLGR